MHNKQVYNLSGKQQGELKDRLAKLKVDFKSPEKSILSIGEKKEEVKNRDAHLKLLDGILYRLK